MDEIFKDLVVIELASVLAGPAVGMFFAELGAKVIKFENINTGGDITRQWKLQNEDIHLPYSAYYCAVNFNKEVIINDLTSEVGYEELEGWIKKADIVISNFKQTSAERIGVDYESLKSIKEDIIYAQLNGYPDQEKVAFDMVLQAETGFLSMCGTSKGEPVKMPVALIDILAAHQLKEGILIALLKKYKTQKGSLVTTSLYESAVSSLANQATNWLMNKVVPKRLGTLHPNIAPYGEVFITKDKKELVLAIGTDKQFENLCSLLKVEDLKANVDFNTNVQRVKHRDRLAQILKEKISEWDCDSLIELAKSANVPVGQVNKMDAVFASPAAMKMIKEDKDKQGNLKRRVQTVAFKIK